MFRERWYKGTTFVVRHRIHKYDEELEFFFNHEEEEDITQNAVYSRFNRYHSNDKGFTERLNSIKAKYKAIGDICSREYHIHSDKIFYNESDNCKYSISYMINQRILKEHPDYIKQYVLKKIIQFYTKNDNLIKFFDLIKVHDTFDKEVQLFINKIADILILNVIEHKNGDLEVLIPNIYKNKCILKEFENKVPLNFKFDREYNYFYTSSYKDLNENAFDLDSFDNDDINLNDKVYVFENQLIEEEVLDLTLISSSTIELNHSIINLDYSNNDNIDVENIIFPSYEDYLNFNNNLNKTRKLLKD